LTEVRYRYL
jgi:hypothetical protein